MLMRVKISYYMPGHILRAPGGRASRILGNWHMQVVRSSALHTGHLVLVSVTGWVNSRTTEWLEGLSQ
jgi:hypothetical protein